MPEKGKTGAVTMTNAKLQQKAKDYGRLLANASEGCPVLEWKPLKVKPHPRQAEMDAIRAIPSRYAK